MRSINAIVASWTLWGMAYYLYSPYITVFLKSLVREEDLIGLFYVLSSLVGLFYALLPRYTTKIKEITIISLLFSGVGLILFSFSENIITVFVSLILYSMYWVSVPVFYVLIRENVAKIWAISMTPAILIPFLGEKLLNVLGIRGIFIIAGMIMVLTALPLINVKFEGRGGDTKENKLNPLPLIFTILPLSISIPYLYISLPLNLIPLIYAIGEGIGILMAYYLNNKEKGLPIALLVFSLISLNNVIPFGAMFYGISEALTALGIDNLKIKSLKDSIKVTVVEISMWLIGYAIATALFTLATFLPTIYASLLAVLFALISVFSIARYILLKVPNTSKVSLKRVFWLDELSEGIFPYFKFA